MKNGLKKEISKEVFDRCTKMRNGTYQLSPDDYVVVFTESERYGYGIYYDYCIEEDGKYYVIYDRGDSCD